MRLMSALSAGFLTLATLTAYPTLIDSYLVVDKSKNQLTYYYHNVKLKTFTVATGRTLEDTPIGVFPVVMLVKNPWFLKKNIPGGAPENPLGVRWIGLEVPGTDGSIYGIHGTNEPKSIGTYASSGCVRMRNEDVTWLYEHVHVGTLVEIVNEGSGLF